MSDASLEEIVRKGEDLYLHKFRIDLEKNHSGLYVAIDTGKEDFVVGQSQIEAIEAAKEKFGQKLFYIIQIGSLDKPTVNYRTQLHAWNF